MLLAQCPVCQETLTSDSLLVAPPCGHTFHQLCLDTWIQTKSSCPSCRITIKKGTAGARRLYFDLIDPLNSSIVNNPIGTSENVELIKHDLQSLKLKVADEVKKRNIAEEILSLTTIRLETVEQDLKNEKSKLKNSDFQMNCLIKQLKDTENRISEAQSIKMQMSEMKEVEIVLNGARSNVDRLVAELDASSRSPKEKIQHLMLYVAVLKDEKDSIKANLDELRKKVEHLIKYRSVQKRKITHLNKQLIDEKEARKEVDRENEELLRKTFSSFPTLPVNFPTAKKSSDIENNSLNIESEMLKASSPKSPIPELYSPNTIKKKLTKTDPVAASSFPKLNLVCDKSTPKLSSAGDFLLNESTEDMFDSDPKSVSIAFHTTPAPTRQPPRHLPTPEMLAADTPQQAKAPKISKFNTGTSNPFRQSPSVNSDKTQVHGSILNLNILRKVSSASTLSVRGSAYPDGMGGRQNPWSSTASTSSLRPIKIVEAKKKLTKKRPNYSKCLVSNAPPKLDNFLSKVSRKD